MKIGIVVSEYYWDDITSHMLEYALRAAKEHEVETEIIKVPGCFDIPLAVKKLLEKDVDGVVTLGAIVQGNTDHDGMIAYTVASKITDLSLKYDKPVVLGVNGPKMSYDDAVLRIDRAAKVTEVCIKMIERLK